MLFKDLNTFKNIVGVVIGLCLILVIITLVPTELFAQPGLPGPEDQEVPIDGGLGVLAALGGTYAIKKLRDKEK